MTPANEKVRQRVRTETRKALITVAEHWGSQRGVDVAELVFRLKTAPVDAIAPSVRKSDQHDGKRKNRRATR